MDFDATLVSDPIILKELLGDERCAPSELGSVPTLVADERLDFEEEQEAHGEGSTHEVDEAGNQKDASTIGDGSGRPRWRGRKPKPQHYEPIAQEPSRPTRRSQARPDFFQAGIPLPKKAIRPLEMVDKMGRGILPTYVAVQQNFPAIRATPCCKMSIGG